MDGGTQKFIALGNIRNLNIDIPSKEEQDKLGRYFESLDHLITLHQRKYFCLEKNKILTITLNSYFKHFIIFSLFKAFIPEKIFSYILA